MGGLLKKSIFSTHTLFVSDKSNDPNDQSPEYKEPTYQTDAPDKSKDALWIHQGDGVYIDKRTKEALFCSLDKYESECGWPNFTKLIKPQNIETRVDMSYGLERTEIVSKDKNGNTYHLGHVFDDIPSGERYCINFSSLEFIPREEMEARGYGEFLYRFEENKNRTQMSPH